MSDANQVHGQLKTAKVVILTALTTLAIGGTAAYLTGYLSLRGPTHIHEDVATGEKTLYSCGMHPFIISEEPGTCPICAMDLTPKLDDPVDTDTGGGERTILYWRAPMVPTEIYDAPGKSAMGMDLVPVYEDEVVGGVEVRVDPVTQQNMGIRTDTAETGPLSRTIRTYGHVTYDETRRAQVSPKFSGWIEKLHVDFTGQQVEKGAPLFEIYSPDLVSAQEEYLSAYRRLKASGNNDFLESARQRLRYSDVPDEHIRSIERSGKVSKTILIRSPFSGVVTHKNAVEGVFVKAGQTIYQIADLSRVWVEGHIFEYELPWVQVGQSASIRLPYAPEREFIGTLAYIYPYLQQKTRDVVVRIEFDNPDLALKPDMFADVMIRCEKDETGTLIPGEAVLRSGERNLAFVTRGDGKFTPREVQLGLSVDGGRVQVLSGVAPGETVVTSGQFLLDSESKLKEAVQKMLEARNPTPEPVAAEEDDFFEDMEKGTGKKDDFFDEM